MACGPGLVHLDTREVGRRALLEASGDPDAIENLLGSSVVDAGLWFVNPSCATQFPVPSEITGERLHAFARCLAGLHLQASTREDALGDAVIMTYAPGFEIEARVVQELAGPRLTWIGYESRRDIADALPTISPAALEALRIEGDHNGPLDASVASALELEGATKTDVAFTWLKVCLDATGAVTAAHPHETTSLVASRAFVAAATTGWHFRPFTTGHQPLPVCAMLRMEYPPDQKTSTERLPLPPPPSQRNKDPIVFAEGKMRASGDNKHEAKRIAGERMIHPDIRTRKAMHAAHVSRAVGSFRLCLDETGHVESVLPVRSTGYADYDREIMAGIRTWLYAPFLVDDQPYPVCTAVTFIYSQQ